MVSFQQRNSIGAIAILGFGHGTFLIQKFGNRL
jgi:hypothetical protein